MDLVETARMRESLVEHGSAGEYVLQTARMVGDEDDHAIWRRSCASWRNAVAATLRRGRPEWSPSALDPCPTGAPGGWKKRYEAELRTVAIGLELLAELDRSLAEQQDASRAVEDQESGASDTEGNDETARPDREPAATPSARRLAGDLRRLARELATV